MLGDKVLGDKLLGDKLRNNAHSPDSMHLSLNELQYPLHQRQQDALAECDRLITHFQKEAIYHKRGFQRLKLLGIVLALTTTILAALAASDRLRGYEWSVPAVSAVATLCTTLMGQTNAQRIWIQSRGVQQKLQAEKFLYLQSAGDYAVILNEEDQIRYFSKRVMDIWSEGQGMGEQSLVKELRRSGRG
jgi:hypothetical protein